MLNNLINKLGIFRPTSFYSIVQNNKSNRSFPAIHFSGQEVSVKSQALCELLSLSVYAFAHS